MCSYRKVDYLHVKILQKWHAGPSSSLPCVTAAKTNPVVNSRLLIRFDLLIQHQVTRRLGDAIEKGIALTR
jgi:hypothetical protein